MTPPMLDAVSVSFSYLVGALAAVWALPTTDARLKKRIVCTKIEKIVTDLN